jgi:hypothetical protein
MSGDGAVEEVSGELTSVAAAVPSAKPEWSGSSQLALQIPSKLDWTVGWSVWRCAGCAGGTWDDVQA